MSGIRCIYIAALALVVFLRKPSKATIYCHALARLCGLQAAPQTLAKPNAHIGAPGKTVAIAERSSMSPAFPYGQSGTGRLSFRLRRLQRNAKHPAIYDSLRSVKGRAVSRLGAFSGKIVGNCATPPLRSGMATF